MQRENEQKLREAAATNTLRIVRELLCIETDPNARDMVLLHGHH